MTKKKTLPTILGLIVLIIGTFLGVFFINQKQIFKLGASGETMPKNLRVSNLTDTSMSVSWTTDKESLGFVVWGDVESKISTVENEGDTKSLTHTVTINSLAPQKKYFFKINSEGTVYDNEGIPWQATTGASLGANKNSNLISGSVITADGKPVKNSLVYANIAGYSMSTTTSNEGNFVFQLGNARSSDLNSYQSINDSQTLIELFVQAPPFGISSAQIYPQSAKPVPPMIIGQTHDFRNNASSVIGDLPEADLELPDDIEELSKFTIPDLELPDTEASVTLDSIENGEQITSSQPQFFGTGPKNENITIKVESENPVTQDVKVASNGEWSWTVPNNLAEGAHKITISWIDINGIKRELTRNFIVQAGEAPSFEASGSANLATSTPSPSPSPISSPSPSPVSGLVPDDVPETGSLTPTMVFFILGMGILSLSFGIWKFADAQSK